VLLVVCGSDGLRDLPSFPTRRSSDLLYGRLHQALGALPADRLDADADLHGGLGGRLADRGQLVVPRGRLAGGAEADLLEALRELLLQEVEHLLRVGRARLELDAGFDVLGFLAE